MRKLLPSWALCLSFLLLLAGSPVFSQLINNGATITIQPNAKIICTGNVQNVTGTITNNGKLEVQGNFSNTGTYNTTTSDDSLIMTGAGNVTIDAGGATLSYLQINKDLATNEVKLATSTTVSTGFIFTEGSFTTDPINTPAVVLSAPASAVFSFAGTPGNYKEIVGKVKRTTWVNDVAVVFNEPNMQVTTTSGTPPTDFTVTMIPQAGGGDPTQAEREVTRKFQFATTGGTGYTSTIRYPYLQTELNTNTEANLVPWQLVSTEWNSKTTSVTRDGTANYVNIPGLTVAELANEWKLADPKYTFNVTAYMRGAWSNGIGLMRTNLNTSGLIQLGQPYAASPTSYPGTESVGSMPNANVVDWVLVEFRKPSTGLAADANVSTIAGRKAGFLLNNGAVVDIDGVTPINYDISKQGAGFVVVRHLNHLAIMSNSLPSNATGTFTNNFSLIANVYPNPLATSPPAIILFASAPGNGLYGMWPGDVNRSGAVTTADVSPINSAISGPSAGNTALYNVRDVNRDGNVTTADVSNTNFSIAQFASASTSRAIVNNGKPTVTVSHVPGEATKE